MQKHLNYCFGLLLLYLPYLQGNTAHTQKALRSCSEIDLILK